MKWRDILIGALASLVVTVLGGVAVYYFTKEPDEKAAERLTYSLNQSAQFSGGAQDFAFSSLSVSNSGNVAAKDVAVVVTSKDAEIRDLAITASEGLQEVSRDRSPKSLRVIYKTLLPKETVVLNIILTRPESVKVDVRSTATLGEEAGRSGNLPESSQSKWNQIAGKVVPATGILVIIGLFAFRRLFRRAAQVYNPKSKNNAGFLLLHCGLTRKAEQVLDSAVEDGDCDQFTLSNYALCKAAVGDFEEAEKFILAANFRESKGHAKAVVMFNQSLVRLLEGRKEDAVALLKESISHSRNEIVEYCRSSIFLESVRSEPAFFALLRVD